MKDVWGRNGYGGNGYGFEITCSARSTLDGGGGRCWGREWEMSLGPTHFWCVFTGYQDDIC